MSFTTFHNYFFRKPLVNGTNFHSMFAREQTPGVKSTPCTLRRKMSRKALFAILTVVAIIVVSLITWGFTLTFEDHDESYFTKRELTIESISVSNGSPYAITNTGEVVNLTKSPSTEGQTISVWCNSADTSANACALTRDEVMPRLPTLPPTFPQFLKALFISLLIVGFLAGWFYLIMNIGNF
jgi:hypothetical protein